MLGYSASSMIKNGLAPVDLTILKEVDLLRIEKIGNLPANLEVNQFNQLTEPAPHNITLQAAEFFKRLDSSAGTSTWPVI